MENTGEEIQDRELKVENPEEGRTSRADPVVIVIKGLDTVGSPGFVDSDDMNPAEPMILRDPDEKGLVRRYWRRKEIEGMRKGTGEDWA